MGGYGMYPPAPAWGIMKLGAPLIGGIMKFGAPLIWGIMCPPCPPIMGGIPIGMGGFPIPICMGGGGCVPPLPSCSGSCCDSATVCPAGITSVAAAAAEVSGISPLPAA